MYFSPKREILIKCRNRFEIICNSFMYILLIFWSPYGFTHTHSLCSTQCVQSVVRCVVHSVYNLLSGVLYTVYTICCQVCSTQCVNCTICFQVCCNHEPHLRGNVYVQYREEHEAVKAYAKFNGRFYASRQISCEFVKIEKWKSAICGLYSY